MSALKKYDIEGKEIGEEVIEDQISKHANPQMIKDYIVALRKNLRQWSAKTKGRKEVNVTGAKPRRQKGTGSARQGSFAAPQFRGGGVVFGPRPKFDQHVKINKKEKAAIISTLLIEKFQSNQAIVLQIDDKNIEKTKQIAKFFDNVKYSDKRVLVLSKYTESKNFLRCMENIVKKHHLDPASINGYDLAMCPYLIIVDSSLEDVKAILKRGQKTDE